MILTLLRSFGHARSSYVKKYLQFGQNTKKLLSLRMIFRFDLSCEIKIRESLQRLRFRYVSPALQAAN